MSPGRRLSAPRWAIRLVMVENASRPLSVKSKVTIGSLPPRSGEVLLGVAQLGARQRRVVLDDPPAIGFRRLLAVLAGVALLVADDEDALGHLDDLGALALLGLETLERRRLGLGGVAVVERALGDLVEGVEASGVGRVVVAVRLLRALGGTLDRLVETGDRLLAAVELVVVGPAVLVEDVRFPVVEEQLGGGADLVGGALGVVDARQVHLDLVASEQLELGLGHAERVDALAHDPQRAVQRLLRDLRLLRRRLALVDQLDAALEVEAELASPSWRPPQRRRRSARRRAAG